MSELLASWPLVLARTSVQVAVSVAAVWLLLRIARPSSPGVHRAAWLLVLVQGWWWLQLPVAVPYYEAPPAGEYRAVSVDGGESPRRAEGREAVPGGIRVAVQAMPDGKFSSEARSAGSIASTISWKEALAALWLSGMVFCLARWAFHYVRFVRSISLEPVPADWAQQWDELLAAHGVRRAIPLRVTAQLGPLLCRLPTGYALLVPAELWARLSPAARAGILRHEWAHYRRGDLWKSALIRLLALPQWFNPLAWVAVRRFEEAAEWACDAAARGAGQETWHNYLRALVESDAMAQVRGPYYAAASSHGFSARVQRLLNPLVMEDTVMKKTLILAAALGLAVAGVVRVELVAKEPSGNAKATATGTVAAPMAGKPPYQVWEPAAVDRDFPCDAKLTEAQRLFRDWSEETWPGWLDASWWRSLSAQQQAAAEKQWLEQLAGDDILVREDAIRALAAVGCKRAIPAILRNATDRQFRDNSDRCEACRALGLLGDASVVPELVHLVYHYNWNTCQWAQISLLRLTGQNFGRDLDAWRRWWQAEGKKPPIAAQKVVWASAAELGALADEAAQEASARDWIAERKRKLRMHGPTDQHFGASAGRLQYGAPRREAFPITVELGLVETTVDDIQPDGSIRSLATVDLLNSSKEELKNYQFMMSDYAQVQRITDGDGRPIHFTTKHSGDRFYYDVALNSVVPAGKRLVMKMELTVAKGSKIRAAGQPDVFQYEMNHFPNAPFAVKHTEVHRLPDGAALLNVSPRDVVETLKDGRTELRIERTIPPGGSLQVAYRYRLGGATIPVAVPVGGSTATPPPGDETRVQVHLRILELDRTRMRELGVDFSPEKALGGLALSSAKRRSTVGLQVLGRDNKLNDVLHALEKDKLARVVSEPTLVTINGRPATLQIGGEVPFHVSESAEGRSIDWRKFGTEIGLLPRVLGNGKLRLEIRAAVTELDPSAGIPADGSSPVLRTHQIETGVELQSDQTLVISGFTQVRRAPVPSMTDAVVGVVREAWKETMKAAEDSRTGASKPEAAKEKSASSETSRGDQEIELLILATPRFS